MAGGGGARDGVAGGHRSLPSKSPFRIIPIPSINRTLPEEVPNVSSGDNKLGLRQFTLVRLRILEREHWYGIYVCVCMYIHS